MDEDLKIHPEWEPYTPSFKLLDYAKEGIKKVTSGCPFAFLQ